MSETPIDIVISGLQTQISELKEIISGLNNDQNTSSTAQTAQTAQVRSIENERNALQIENSKLNYQITHLLRALNKKDNEISLLRKDLNKSGFK
ncbi:hypothetical protein RhiirA5_497467 [Rhizophagus irregularis]|uniref:Uncharacterized protein n=3 Tax=Rhizophagus irregularis TaxID=588596 RepID=A0A2I1DXC5_9GLOM|nr:hypothetical protein GLOIN_2v1777920 [Rhizophagus irregularis DAOM 181602=DAOM 197198]EXX64512.1 hypothetical protein RirG_141970 [Rhizophagus irregularis DAOM 197198w]PKC11742.1 hypothetical protein RhiirA5_497467 [Rhizophagus irregularis]PKC71910.1 hypothetical protein RhiirA1_531652 [Rhizophagus irregularis]PKY14528.1 hypothetical protein RhiirB3_519691 [Rhizophagus irregularis]PKY43437.1 hypothetical protein RhiirA4_541130 [Rhizophagus irregularis]|eukprot:XP_025175577.1 hypothetical protein GLOIN_2v1777920 [Rhizophagus irregularis DAOM 181602=DAOM 197198]